MTVDMSSFTPIAALAGGALIGLAAALLLLLNGRIAGISGIVGGLLRPKAGDIRWRLAFVIGLMAAPLLYRVIVLWPESHRLTVSEYTQLALVTVRQVDTSVPVLVIAGLLVGIGTRYASGCTSGHGVCGLSRLSVRSLVATLCFMGSGFATVFVMRHVIGG
jgi:uncharacterized membrane protein YedE/YeeE